MNRWTQGVTEAAFLGELDKEVAAVRLPSSLDHAYERFVADLDKFDFVALVATLTTRLGYADVTTVSAGENQALDILARCPARYMKFSVGLQCQQLEAPRAHIGPSALTELRSSLSQYSCQAGVIVTNGRFSRRAENIQVRPGSLPIRCVDGSHLRKLLFSLGIGLEEPTPGEFLVAPRVWRQQLEKGDVERSVSTLFIPQADKLELVMKVVRSVQAGAGTRLQLADALGYSARQGHYYAVAAEALQLITLQSDGRLSLLPGGLELCAAAGRPARELQVLRKAMRKIRVYDQMFRYLRGSRDWIPHSQVAKEWKRVTLLQDSTAQRRLVTMLRWFEDVEVIERRGGGEKSRIRFIG